jgi:hypothetical protein
MTRLTAALAFLALVFFASPAAAATPLSIEGYWAGFLRFWGGVFGSITGVVGVVIIVGIISIFIITRGKWLK